MTSLVVPVHNVEFINEVQLCKPGRLYNITWPAFVAWWRIVITNTTAAQKRIISTHLLKPM